MGSSRSWLDYVMSISVKPFDATLARSQSAAGDLAFLSRMARDAYQPALCQRSGSRSGVRISTGIWRAVFS
jgi:hypothetical protein